jgi:Flp pilus assembly protein CpaB
VLSKLTSRTKAALMAGVILLVAGGGGAVYLQTKNPAASAAVPKVQAFFTTTAIPAGTAGSNAIAQGAIQAKSILPDQRPADAVTDGAQLSGRVATVAIPAGTMVVASMFPDPQTHIGTVVIPAGKRALALEIAPLPGVAGFVGTGDKIDVYGIAKDAAGQPQVRLVLQGVDVLNVNGAPLPAVQGQVGSQDLIYLLAVVPADAERLIYLNSFEKLYFDLVPKGEGPVKTPGAGPAGALAV